MIRPQGTLTRRPVAELRGDPDLAAVQEFAELVVASSRSSRQRERLRRAVESPVTTASLTVLRLVERAGPLTLSEAARRLELDQSTLSRQVRPLEDEGLVARQPDVADRRAARLTVTQAGRRMLRRLRDVALNDYDVALSDWEPAERARLGAMLERLRADLLRTHADASGWAVDKQDALGEG